MAAAAWCSNVFAVEYKRCGLVLKDAKHRWAKAGHGVALCAFTGAAGRELAVVLIFVTPDAGIKCELAVAGVCRQRLEMAFGACGIDVFALQRIHGLFVRIAADFFRHTKPFDRAMAIITIFAKRRFVHHGVAAHALFAFARRLVVTFVVTAFAFNPSVPVG